MSMLCSLGLHKWHKQGDLEEFEYKCERCGKMKDKREKEDG